MGFTPPPNPLAQAEQMKLQADVQKTQAQAQLDIQKFQAQAQLDAQQAAADAALEQAKLELEKYKADLQAQTQIQIAQIKAAADAALERDRMALQVAQGDVSTQLEVARMQMPAQDAARSKQETESRLVEMIEGLKPVAVEAVRDDLGRLVGSVATYADGTKRQIQVRM
jgi:autotransporter translocation and assembly factor TamB